MPSIERPLSGDGLLFNLEEELERTAGHPALEQHGRIARTLAKDGPLRVIMVALAPGGTLEEHRATGPVTIQTLRGDVRVSFEGRDEELAAGQLLVLGAGVPHGVASPGGGAFLLTVLHPPAAKEDDR